MGARGRPDTTLPGAPPRRGVPGERAGTPAARRSRGSGPGAPACCGRAPWPGREGHAPEAGAPACMTGRRRRHSKEAFGWPETYLKS